MQSLGRDRTGAGQLQVFQLSQPKCQRRGCRNHLGLSNPMAVVWARNEGSKLFSSCVVPVTFSHLSHLSLLDPPQALHLPES